MLLKLIMNCKISGVLFHIKQFILIFLLVTTNSSTIQLESSRVQLISSPGYPSYYPRYTQRRFFIRAPEGYNVKLDVLDLWIPSGCYNDHIEIYDGIFFIFYLIRINVSRVNTCHQLVDVPHPLLQSRIILDI